LTVDNYQLYLTLVQVKLGHQFFRHMTVDCWAVSSRRLETNTFYRKVVAQITNKAGSYFRSTDTSTTVLRKFKKMLSVRIMLTQRRVSVTIAVV